MECTRSKTEYNENFSLSFIRKGNFLYNTFRGSLDSYTGYVLVSKPGYEYTITHPAIAPDECTIISFSNAFYERLKEQFRIKESSFFNKADMQSLLLKLKPGTEYLHNELVSVLIKNNKTKLETDSRVMELLELVVCSITDHKIPLTIPVRLKKEHLVTIEKAKEYLAKNLSQDISLEDIAGHCYVSPFHFSRIFKTFTGYSPYQYLLQLRMKQAEVLYKPGFRWQILHSPAASIVLKIFLWHLKKNIR